MSKNILDSGIKSVKNVSSFNVGFGSIKELPEVINQQRNVSGGQAVYLVDHFFRGKNELIGQLGIEPDDFIEFIDSSYEPTTEGIDKIVAILKSGGYSRPAAIVGIGGGVVLDTSKAISNLLTNGGSAAEYQGWDLVRVPGIFKVGIPTISGTGAEATRTCVMTNKSNGLKLGMNSGHTVFNHIIMDPELTSTVPRDQYFFTGMDAYIHCIESLAGSYRNAIGDAFSRETVELCHQVFLSEDMLIPANREKLMVASYLGGCAIATSYVGIIHPFSAGLSVVLGLHHCIANCIVMRAMQPFYPRECDEFWRMAEKQGVNIPKGLAHNLTDIQYEQLFAATIVHEKPLTNALGESFRKILTMERVTEIFKTM
jgi:3-deoxy-alpha-D-manno-octulosonate 8-oxidase